MCILSICQLLAQAQNYRAYARRYGMEEGLPHRQVNSVIQDRRGFIWAATNGGVVRFDGQRFKIFNKTDTGLSGERVDWVAEDADGNIWVYERQPSPSLDIIDPISGKVTPAALFWKNQPLPVDLNRLRQPPQQQTDGTLVLGLDQPAGCLFYRPKTGWQLLELPSCAYFNLAKITAKSTIWGVCGGDDPNTNTLVEMDERGNWLRQYAPAPGNRFALKKGGNDDPDAFFVLEGSPSEHNLIWEINSDGTRQLAKSYLNYTFTPQYARVANDRLTVQFPGIFDASGRCILDLGRQFPALDHYQYCDYLLDKSGNIWLGTAFGLIVVDVQQDHFQRFLYDEQAPGGRGYACRGLLEKDGALIVNVETLRKGRFKVNLKTGAAKRLPGEYAIGIAESSDGNIWTECGRPDSGWYYIYLAKTSPEGQLLGPALTQKKADGGSIWAIFEENPARVLLGHSIGITIFNPMTGLAKPWADPACPDLDHAGINSIQRNRAGDICVCAAQGFFRLKPGGGVLDRYWSSGKGSFYLPYDNILSFYEDAAGIFWLGTSGGGLIRWIPPFSKISDTLKEKPNAMVLFRKNGLLNGVVYAVYEDAKEHLWLPTDYGIAQFDKKKLQVRRTWLLSAGLSHDEFNRTSHCRGRDGRLYFGGLNGVTAFDPKDFYRSDKDGASDIALVISDFSVLDGNSGQLENRTAALLASKEITVRPNDRYFQLEFALLDYTAPEKVSYAWKLEGLATDWETLKEPLLRLSSLPLGKHRLRIRAQAADGTWAENMLDLQLVVLPPFYLRTWFLCLALCLLAAGIWGWLSWRTRRHRLEQERLEAEVARQTATIRRQTEELKQLDAAKSRFFANVSHELRTPLTLILGPLSSLLKGNYLEGHGVQYATTARQHGEQLLGLVNEILDLSKMESGKMKLHETAVSLQPFLRRVVSAFESHAERLGILLVFEYALPERLRVLLDEDKLQKVLNNLLSNALKFTPPQQGGSVVVRAGESEGCLQVAVRDTGRGIHPDDLPHVFERFYQTAQTDAPLEGGTGIGLALCREFAALMEGRIWVESALGEGSTFYFEYPKKEVLGVGPELADEPLAMAAVPVPTLQDASAVPSNAARPTLLVVEDNDSMREYVSSVLSGPYKVVTAENGQVALDFLQGVAQCPDLIVSDIMMPLLDGFQLLERLKGDDRWRHIPVVMLTARADIRDKLRALRIGVDDYLLKPFEEDELLARVENLLCHYRNRQTGSGKAAAPDEIEAEAVYPLSPVVSADDQVWLETFEKLVERCLGDFDLTAERLAEAMAMSRAPFFRQLKRLTGLTPAQYIDEARFQKARHLFERREASSVKAVAYTVGFRQVKHFSQNYKKRFGKLPSDYAA